MALRADRLNSPIRNSITQYILPDTNTSSKGSILTSQAYAAPARTLVLPANMTQELLPQEEQANEISFELLEFLIENLQAVASEKLDPGIGFKPSPKEEDEIKLGKKAQVLASTLLDRPSEGAVKLARRFLKVIKIIERLEETARERNIVNLGFRLDKKNATDTQFAEKILECAKNLKISDSTKNIKEAMNLIAQISIIEELEDIAKDKVRGTLGLRQEPVNKHHEKIEETATQLANFLKINPDNEMIAAALQFIQLVEVLDTQEKFNHLAEKNSCFGYHCVGKQNELPIAIAA